MSKKQNPEVGTSEINEKGAPQTQAPTIRDAVTYIVDENGVEKKLDPITQISKDDFTDSKKSD